MVMDSILNKTEFAAKDKTLAEFVAFSNKKTILNVGGKLVLTSPDDITKKIMDLYKAGNYIEANELLKTSESTIDNKKYLENLLSNKNYSFRFDTTPYLKLIDAAIKQKSNVSTILKKKLCNEIKEKLETTDILSKQKNMILKTINSFEKDFKEKGWGSYSLFEMGLDEIEIIKMRESSYEFACFKTIIEEFKKELKNMNLSSEEIKDVSNFYFNSEFAGNVFRLYTYVYIIENKTKPIFMIHISFGTHRATLKSINYENKIPSGEKILNGSKVRNLEFDIDYDEDEHGLTFLNCNLKYEIPLSKLLIKDKNDYYNVFKNLLFESKNISNIKEPKSIEEIKKVISIKTEYQLKEILFRQISNWLFANSNVISFSSPTILPIVHNILTGKKLNE